ncbi:AAA family ATPase [Mycobacterium sp. NPDC003449]
MLLWINGPFGVGKTQTAYELHRRLPGSVVCDPEFVGYGLHRAMPRQLRADFQDMPAWRQGVFEVLDFTLRRHGGPVIAPMTVIEPRYFAETVGRLRDAGHPVFHFALLARRETVLNRLADRGLGLGGLLRRAGRQELMLRREAFAVERLDRGLENLALPEFADQVWTDTRTIPDVATHIGAVAGVPLLPNTDGAVRAGLRRVAVTARHIRL